MASQRGTRVRAEIALAQNLMLAPWVVGLRLPILVAEATGSLVSGRPETVKAVSEKVSALAQGIFAAQVAWTRGALTLPLAIADASSPLADIGQSMALAALEPAGRQVRLNHRRLSRRRKRLSRKRRKHPQQRCNCRSPSMNVRWQCKTWRNFNENLFWGGGAENDFYHRIPGGRDHLTDAKRTRRRRIDTSVGIQLLAVNGGVGN
ncbi:hypothetical protein [Mesorhizobium sp.]|uniref:hypothetical protein n=2 Tax=Mesorhizobium sp. TaxID=1871066 RepID=UPI001226C931|nr:hypothetical protein [Mesorhizobium sp.]TIL29042.1 MAG: hypothetical protein E5Y85_29910 [Mesorhizobium sp.]